LALLHHISSHAIDAAQFNPQIRQHWSIEDGCYWVLDVAFREDLSRVRIGHGTEHFAVLRRMTLNLINRNTTIKSGRKSQAEIGSLGYHPRAGTPGA
jgi:predicted transposase YbfD/YdcC